MVQAKTKVKAGVSNGPMPHAGKKSGLGVDSGRLPRQPAAVKHPMSALKRPPSKAGKLIVRNHSLTGQKYIVSADPQARIALIRQGIPASTITQLSSRMGMTKENLLASLGLSRATISRKEKEASVLSKDESERVLGVETLIGLVQKMVEESGDPEGFDAARWVADWMMRPLPALAGATPASYMDTFEGQKLVADLLAMTQSGAYA